MTLIVGIVCKDGIVIAGDSQTSWESAKSWDANKITALKFPKGDAIVAEAGATITSGSILEEFQKSLRNEKLTEQYSLPELAKIAVRKVRDALRFQNFECSSEELQAAIERHGLDSTLMFAHYEGGVPQLNTINLTIGITQRSKQLFEVVGSGREVEGCILVEKVGGGQG